MRTFLRVEAAALRKGMTAHEKGLKARLERTLKRLEQDTDTVLLSDLGAIRDELAAVRRGLARQVISEQPTLKLKNEWHDWLHHAERAPDEDHELRSERLEMLASELRLRGVDVPVAEIPRPRRPSVPVEVRIEAEEPPSFTTQEPAATEEETEQIVDSLVDEAGEYWERLIAGLHPDHSDPEQLARLLKAFRAIQGERKRQDRLMGVRRYRLTAFETWA